MLDASYEGKELGPFTFRIEREGIWEFCRALKEENSLHYDTASAREAGYRNTPAPLTFCTTLLFKMPGLWDILRDSGMNTGKMMHSKEEYDFFSVIYPGDTLQCTFTIEFLHSTATTDMITVSTRVTKNGEKVTIARTTLISPGGKSSERNS